MRGKLILRRHQRVEKTDFNREGMPVTLIVPSPFENKWGKLRRPTARERRRLEQIYGAPIIVDGFDYGKKPRRIRGLVVHLVESQQGVRDYRGDENLFDGRSKLYRELLDNKWLEYQVIQKVDLTIMPTSILAETLLQNSTLPISLGRYFQSSQAEIPDRLQTQLEAFLKKFFMVVEKKFPQGAFIKYIREYRTCEADQLTHTPEANPTKMTEIFCREMETIKSNLRGRSRRWRSPALLKAIQESQKAAVHILGFLLLDPKLIMVQEKLAIAKTRDGTLAEVRVDFGSMGPIAANVRWGYDVETDYKRRAFDFFQKVWRQWPASLKQQFGGADVVFLKDGSMKIIEFNFGSESGFMDATQLIVPGNLFMTKILGRPTPLIQRLEKLVKMKPQDQANELNKLIPRTKRNDETHLSMRDLHLGDVWLYLRDRLVEEWMKSPTKKGARQLSQQLRFLAKSQLRRIEDPETQQLILDMARFGKEAMLEFLNKRRIKKSCHPSAPSEQLALF